MWLLTFVPDVLLIWIINTILLAGIAATIAGFFIKIIPFVDQYRLPVQIVGVLLLVIGVYLKGGYGVEMEWRGRVADAEAKVAKAEAQAKEANKKLEESLAQKSKDVKDAKVVIEQKIKVVEKKMDENCKIIPEVVDILNQAAKKPEVKK